MILSVFWGRWYRGIRFGFLPVVWFARLLPQMLTKSQASSATIIILLTVAPTIMPVLSLAGGPLLLATVGECVGEVVEVVVIGFDVMGECDIAVDSDVTVE